jgi:hypothetical protein
MEFEVQIVVQILTYSSSKQKRYLEWHPLANICILWSSMVGFCLGWMLLYLPASVKPATTLIRLIRSQWPYSLMSAGCKAHLDCLEGLWLRIPRAWCRSLPNKKYGFVGSGA